MAEQSIRSNRFGRISVSEDSVIDFPEGLIGLPHLHRFSVVKSKKASSPFKCLVSIDDPEVGFAVADPSQLFSDYTVDAAAECEVLGAAAAETLSVLVILSVPEDPIRTTANLLAPLVVNQESRLGRQMVLSDSRYSTRHPIIAPRQAG